MTTPTSLLSTLPILCRPLYLHTPLFSLSHSIKAYVLNSIMYGHTADQLNEAAGLPSGKLPAPPAHTMRSTSHDASIASRRYIPPDDRLYP
jgi:hypothetical protein